MIMPEPTFVIAATALIGLVIVVGGLLKAWQGWLALKQREIDVHAQPAGSTRGSPIAAARIELSDLKERIRKLEAIASGVDL